MSKITLTAPNKAVVTDSFIKSIVVGKKSGNVKIAFTNGDAWIYEGSTQTDFDALVSAPSLGRHFAQVFKPTFKNSAIPA